MTMRAIVDIRKVHLRGSERILLDMLDRNRESGATPIVRVDSEAPTALIPKTKIK